MAVALQPFRALYSATTQPSACLPFPSAGQPSRRVRAGLRRRLRPQTNQDDTRRPCAVLA